MPAAVPEVTDTEPQVALPAHAPVGPLTLAPAMAEKLTELTAACPELLSVQVCVAAVGEVVGLMLLQPVSTIAAGVMTVRLMAVDAGEPALGVAVRVPL